MRAARVRGNGSRSVSFRLSSVLPRGTPLNRATRRQVASQDSWRRPFVEESADVLSSSSPEPAVPEQSLQVHGVDGVSSLSRRKGRVVKRS